MDLATSVSYHCACYFLTRAGTHPRAVLVFAWQAMGLSTFILLVPQLDIVAESERSLQPTRGGTQAVFIWFFACDCQHSFVPNKGWNAGSIHLVFACDCQHSFVPNKGWNTGSIHFVFDKQCDCQHSHVLHKVCSIHLHVFA